MFYSCYECRPITNTLKLITLSSLNFRHHQVPIRRNHNKSASNDEYEHFFRYDSGRWLWDEKVNLRQRYRKFNVDELQKAAADVAGAQHCSSMVKLAEDGSSSVFRLVMDNGHVVIAHIPYDLTWPKSWPDASEAATINFVRVLYIAFNIKEKC
jgi:hypothetical protein